MIEYVGTRIRAAEPDDRPALEPFLARWHSLRVARRGELVPPLDHPMLVAEDNGRLVGLLTEVKRIARRAGCKRLRVITTNDNVDALRFYQRRGFRLAALRAGAVEDARARLKPEIPWTGANGIELRDELELEKVPAR
jgi:GNAT superfamily N-acetyltransferase